MTGTSVEARSLSSLTFLASNPPQYPRNPTQQKHDPLVLYIARVPGSKDVFLTPLKPREKVVTAEDVHSSLYYLHVDQPESSLFDGNDGAANDGGYYQPEEQGQPTIQRKPLPEPPLETFSSTPSASLRFYARSPNPWERAQRDVAPPSGLSVRSGVESSFNIAASSVSRKPVGSRPPNHTRGYSDGLPRRGQENQHPDIYGRRQSEQLPLYPTLPVRDGRLGERFGRSSEEVIRRKAVHSRSVNVPYESFGEPARYRPESPLRHDHTLHSLSPGGVSLTLIRRDPTSGAQWNVAKIKDPPVDEVSSDALRNPAVAAQRKKQSGSPMYIQVDTPGYSKFLYDDETRPRLQSRNSNNSSAWTDVFDGPRASLDWNERAERDRVFRRRLWMEGTRYSGDFGHRKVSSNGSVSGSELPNGTIDLPRSSGEVLRSSSDFSHLPVQHDNQPGRRTLTVDGPRSSFRGYVFLSPWNGRCEFLTGAAGRTLKCKHTIPTNSSAASQPDSVSVSELRFNLPTLVAKSAPSTPSEYSTSSLKRPSAFARPRLRSQNSSYTGPLSSLQGRSDVATDLARLDLSLGQEIAGGGFGGKQAKLGKLIIEDEGLKMLDLLVAANLALWWRAYERVYES